ncbi:hypothetical protein E4U41_001228 [Claviceps citrina]|nr:hypothetical protein E4U41_001228 [Claviceps citrina]
MKMNPGRENSMTDAQEFLRSQTTSETSRQPSNSATRPTNRPGGYGGLGDPMPNTLDKQHTRENFMDRMKNATPGPFHPARRPSATPTVSSQRKDSLDQQTPSLDEPSAQLSPMHPTLSAPDFRRERSLSPCQRGHERDKSMGPKSPRRPPPQTSLLPNHQLRNPESVDLAAEFGVRNPYHTPTSSASSGHSDHSIASHDTALTSPTRSHTSQSECDHTTVKGTMSNEDEAKPSNLRIDATGTSPRLFAPQMVQSPCGTLPRDFRFDPASSGGQDIPPSRGEHNPPLRQDGGYMSEERGFQTPNAALNLPPPRRQDTPERQGSIGNISSPSRGDCRACGIAITGKSISSADGRLTGKYHKACFVCSTCSHPFSSSVFYVLDDKPYCEQDYHKLNHSLCGSCGRGIEGQFAEDEAKVKHHLSCFRCLDCGLSLAEGYFEVGGYAYCERDAWRRVQAQSYAEQETHQPGPPRRAAGDRLMPNGFGPSARPGPRAGSPSGRPYPPPLNPNPRGGRLAAGADQRFRMNKRMTRLGNMNM